VAGSGGGKEECEAWGGRAMAPYMDGLAGGVKHAGRDQSWQKTSNTGKGLGGFSEPRGIFTLTSMERRMKAMIAIAAVSVLALSVSAPAPAVAGNGGAVAAGVIGGLAAGAIIGSAAANANRSYYSGPAYVDQPAYVVDPGYRRCHIAHQEFVDAYGNLRVRRIRVCD
jgi:hypothetical protein